MNPSILVFTRDQNLLFELGHQLDDKHPIVPCETLDSLPERLKAQPIGAVLVHLERHAQRLFAGPLHRRARRRDRERPDVWPARPTTARRG